MVSGFSSSAETAMTLADASDTRPTASSTAAVRMAYCTYASDWYGSWCGSVGAAASGGGRVNRSSASCASSRIACWCR